VTVRVVGGRVLLGRDEGKVAHAVAVVSDVPERVVSELAVGEGWRAVVEEVFFVDDDDGVVVIVECEVLRLVQHHAARGLFVVDVVIRLHEVLWGLLWLRLWLRLLQMLSGWKLRWLRLLLQVVVGVGGVLHGLVVKEVWVWLL